MFEPSGADTTPASGKLVFGIFAALAEFERALISEQTIAGLATACARGRIGGRPLPDDSGQGPPGHGRQGGKETKIGAVMASTPSIQKWDEIFDQVLAKNGMDKGEIKRRPQGALKIIQEATIAFDLRKTPAMMWQMCSAATHGKKWVTGILTMMDGQDDGESKVISGKLTSDEMLILLATHAACLLIRPLFEVQARHSKPENHSGESFLKPSHRLLVPSRGFLVPDRFNC